LAREAQTNAENKRGPRKDNKSGFLGVCWHPQARKWRARIQLRGKSHDAGLYDTPEEAYAAYVAAKRKLHAGCTI